MALFDQPVLPFVPLFDRTPSTMKENTHPKYESVIFCDVSCDYKFLSRSTKIPSEKMKWTDGKEYPVIRVDISSESHPFYTGENRMLDTEGRVDKFKKRYASQTPVKK